MPSPLSILQITDLHILAEQDKKMSGVDTRKSFAEVLQYAIQQQQEIDLILISGDLAQDPYLTSYQYIFDTLTPYQIRTVCLPGNHDDFDLMKQVFNSPQINCDKHLTFHDWDIICLNSKKEGSQGGYLSHSELDYLRDQLINNHHKNVLIAVHHHPVEIKSKWMDKMIIENNETLFLLLKDYPQVKAITCGHIHQKLEIKIDQHLILGTPSTCFQFTPLSSKYAIDNLSPAFRTLLLYPDGQIDSKVHYLSLKF